MTWWGVNEGTKVIPGYDEIDVVGGEMWALGIPDTASPEFRRNAVGAAVASVVGLRVDYALKRYVGPAEQYALPEVDKPFRAGLREVRRVVVAALASTMTNRGSQTEAAFVADSAMIRLQNTFRGAVILIKSHLHFETSALLRLIVEQMAWAWAIHRYEGDYWELEPQGCIRQLKIILPDIGRMYGQLSESAHVIPPTTLRYIRSSPDKITVYFAVPSQSAQDLLTLLRLAADFASVCERLHPESPAVVRPGKSPNLREWSDEFRAVYESVAEWAAYVEANSLSST